MLNGHPHRVFRVRLNSEKQVSFGALLNEVSQGLRSAIFRLYNFDGAQITGIDQLLELREPRVVAVPRSERLQLNG